MEYRPIGVIRTPHKRPDEMPIQPAGAAGVTGRIELDPELVDGLKDLDGFSHIIILYHFHQTAMAQLVVTPFLDQSPHGVFATRAPSRPNPIGLSIVRLLAIDRNILTVEGVDVLDNTPLIDIKPYVPHIDHPEGRIRSGWLEGCTRPEIASTRSDRRFDNDT